MSARRRGTARRRNSSAAVQPALFEVDLRPGARYYRQILDALARSDFGADADSAERVVSKLFGAVWAAQDVPRDGSTEEAFGLGLVDQARARRSHASLALLGVLADIAPIREVREAAARAAAVVSVHGKPVTSTGRCWAYEDVFGDLVTVMCEYESGSSDTYAVAIRVDRAMFSTATDVWITEDVDGAIRDLHNAGEASELMFTLRLVDPAWARAYAERAFARTDLVPGVELGTGFADLRSLVLARLRLLTDNPAVLPPEPRSPTRDERQAMVVEFLTDWHDIPDFESAEVIAALIVKYSSEYDPGGITRVSPAKWEVFLNEWLPVRMPPDPIRTAVPDVVRAWSAWAARRQHLDGPTRDELTRSLDELLEDVFHESAVARAG